MKITSWEGAALPTPPTGWGMGKPGFPIPLRTGCALPNSPASEGMGEPGSPIVHVRFQSSTVPSRLALARVWPSGLQATLCTQSLWPVRVVMGMPS